MNLFRHKVIAGFLLAFWLLATQHCRLEAAGLIEPHAVADQTCCPGGEAHCSHDGCDTVENEGYRIDSDSAVIPAPQFAACLCLICWNLSVPSFEIREGDASSSENFERPLNWVPTWQFVQRAALLPRAPSFVLA
ncbi:MAG: hypothetical protein Q7S40_30605 [Opitutaceae bacterium]|nr:hypothetical protein [Opitutaceae bacterium]